MIWYGVEPLATVDAARTASLIGKCAIPLVRTNLVRRLVERDAKELAMALPPLVDWLAGQTNPELVRDVLEGMARAWRGRHDISRPENWASLAKAPFAADPQLTWLLDELSARLGDDAAREKLLDTLKSADAPAERRVEALTELVEMRYPPLAASLPALLSDKALRGPAARALSAFDDPQTPQRLLAVYAQLDDDDRATVVATLASRPKYAEALLTAVAANQVPKGDIPLTIVRQLKALKQKPLDEAIAKIWGALRPPSKDKQAEKLRWQERLGPTELAKADLKQGRAVFAKTCANCHVLFDAGKKIGPELTGSQRTNLDYVLDNVLDPSAAVARDYQMTQLVLADGRLLTGMIVEENDQTVTLQTPTERSTFAKADIEDRTRSPLSMMPEGIFGSLSVEDVLALVAYLASPQQVPLK
jgi:putative heme-binding domain-containing protein